MGFHRLTRLGGTAALTVLLSACSVYGTSLLLPGDAPDARDGSAAAGTGDASTGSGGRAGAGLGSDAGEDGRADLCGNGAIDPGEDCDLGMANGTGQGCEERCSWTCAPGALGDEGCDDGDICNGTETCSPSHACIHGASLPDSTVCGTGMLCKNGTCVGRCGDGVVQADEDCEPPGTTACDAQCHTLCDMTGKWALKVSLPVSWKNSGTPKGAGDVIEWALIDRSISGTTVVETGNVCKLVLPDYGVVGHRYALMFPSPLGFDAPFSTTAAFDGFKVGTSYTTPLTAIVLGASLASPTADAWPSSETLVNNVQRKLVPYATDDDGDGKPGITATVKLGVEYSYLPTSDIQLADKAYVSLRLSSSLSGTIDECATVTGSVPVVSLDLAIVGCHLFPLSAECSNAARKSVDGSRPVYESASKGDFLMQKLDASADCAHVIATLP